MKNLRWAVLYSVVFSFLGAGILFLVTRSPRGQPILLPPAPTAMQLQVYIVGAVNQPGVYALPPGSRVQEAVDLAGGFTTQADLQAINLAATLEDGERVMIPARQEASDTRSGSLSVDTANSLPLVNINTASQSELESLPEIGPVIAREILAYREQNGAFNTVDDLQKVPGIGPKTFERLKPLITVGDR